MQTLVAWLYFRSNKNIIIIFLFQEIIPEQLVKIVEPTPAQTNKKDIENITTNKEETEEISVTAGGADHTIQPEIKIEIVDTPQPSPRVTGRTRAPKPGRPGMIKC